MGKHQELFKEFRTKLQRTFGGRPATEETRQEILHAIDTFLISINSYNIQEFFEIRMEMKYTGDFMIHFDLYQDRIDEARVAPWTHVEIAFMKHLGLSVEALGLRSPFPCPHENMEVVEWNFPESISHKCLDCDKIATFRGLSVESYKEEYKDGENDR